MLAPVKKNNKEMEMERHFKGVLCFNCTRVHPFQSHYYFFSNKIEAWIDKFVPKSLLYFDFSSCLFHLELYFQMS